jgi:hypothetical protein
MGCGIYGVYNFNEDKEKGLKIMNFAFNGNVQQVLIEIDSVEVFVNPIINYKYQGLKKKYIARFVDQTEIMENDFENKVIYGIANIYRDYWKIELLKLDAKKTDSLLYNHLTDYIVENNLTNIGRDSLRSSLRNDVELTRIIENEGFQCKFFFLNGMQDLLIWKEERIEKEIVDLPTGSLEVSIVNVDHLLLTGYSGYASFDIKTTGGWAVKENPVIYCIGDGYDISSEKYLISYLKHESIHYLDLNKYPNLSSADLEYRAKLIELMYCSEESIYSRIAEFLNGASSKDKSYSHPYANYCIMRDFSKVIFNNDYEDAYAKWLQIDVEKLNQVATQLFESNEKKLLNKSDTFRLI